MNTRYPQLFAILILAAGALAISLMGGCAKEASTSSSFDGIYDASFATTCNNCHGPGGSATLNGTILDFSSADTAYNDLLNRAVQSVSNPSQCLNVRRVQPGTPTSSYLLAMFSSQYRKSNFAGVAGCSPYAGHATLLTDSEITAIANWISAGASR